MLAFHRREPAALAQHCSRARHVMVPLLAAAGMESYSNAYPSLVKLQVLHELQCAAPFIRTADGASSACVQSLSDLIEIWSARLKHMSSSPNTLEGLFAARCCVCYELYAQHGSAQSPIGPTALAGFRKNWLRCAKTRRMTAQ